MSADETTIASMLEAIFSIVNKLVENEGARFPFLVVVGLNGSISYSRVDLIEGERGESRTIVAKRIDGGFKFPVNIMCIDGSGKGYLAVIGAENAAVHLRGAIGNEACRANFPDLIERPPTLPPRRTPARRS